MRAGVAARSTAPCRTATWWGRVWQLLLRASFDRRPRDTRGQARVLGHVLFGTREARPLGSADSRTAAFVHDLQPAIQWQSSIEERGISPAMDPQPVESTSARHRRFAHRGNSLRNIRASVHRARICPSFGESDTDRGRPHCRKVLCISGQIARKPWSFFRIRNGVRICFPHEPPRHPVPAAGEYRRNWTR